MIAAEADVSRQAVTDLQAQYAALEKENLATRAAAAEAKAYNMRNIALYYQSAAQSPHADAA